MARSDASANASRPRRLGPRRLFRALPPLPLIRWKHGAGARLAQAGQLDELARTLCSDQTPQRDPSRTPHPRGLAARGDAQLLGSERARRDGDFGGPDGAPADRRTALRSGNGRLQLAQGDLDRSLSQRVDDRALDPALAVKKQPGRERQVLRSEGSDFEPGPPTVERGRDHREPDADILLAVRSDDVFRPGPDLRPQRTERRQEVRAAHGKQERRLARGGHRRFLRSGRWTRTCGHGQEQWEQHGESVAQHLVRMQP